MKIGIVGAGFTGLAAAFVSSKLGHSVTIFEAGNQAGGLADGFRNKDWDWALDKHYHHLFTSDWSIRHLAEEVGCQIDFVTPKTSTYIDARKYQLDSPLSLLAFPKLPIIDRIRTGIGLALLKFNPIWQIFEHFTSEQYIRTIMGNKSWDVIWAPLFHGKFGEYASQISAVWFWARIFKRSQSLGYPRGGFTGLLEKLVAACKKQGVEFIYSSKISRIVSRTDSQVELWIGNRKHLFSKVICSLSSWQFAQIAEGLPETYKQKLTSAVGLGAIDLVLELKESFLSDGTYWLNINDRSMPYLAVVEHTNFVSRSHYAGKHLLYIGNYLKSSHRFFSLSPQELLKEYLPHLRKINPQFSANAVSASWIWKTPFAQPIVSVGYAASLPGQITPLPNVYLANMQQVYPWDRGTNYAVESGRRITDLIMS